MTHANSKNMSDKKVLNYKHMQEQLRGELTGSEVHLSEGKLKGRIHVELEAEVLTTLLNKVDQQKKGKYCIQEREQMMAEISHLKAQLDRPLIANFADAVKGVKPTTTTPTPKELEKVSGLKAQLVQMEQEHTAKIKSLRSQLKMLTEEQLDTQNKLQQETSCCIDLQAQLDQLEGLNAGLERDLQQERASAEAQLEDKMKEMDTAKAALEEAKLQFNSNCLNWQEKIRSLAKQGEEMSQALQKKAQDHETNQSQWEVEKASLVQISDALKTTLLQKEQDWESKEKALNSKLEDLEAEIKKKKLAKKNKWYRRLFRRLHFWGQEQDA